MVTRSHKLRSRLILALAILLILLAVMFSLFRLLAPHVTDYAEEIEAEISRQLGTRVDVGMLSVDTWHLLPRLKLMDVSIYDPTGERHLLHIDEIMLGLDWYGSLLRQQPQLGFVVLNGWNLQITHDRDGQWIIQGMVLPKTEGPFELPPDIAALLQRTAIYLENGHLDWQDLQHNAQRLSLNDVRLALINDAPHHQLSLDVELPRNYGGHVQIKADMRGPLMQPEQWQGKAYVSVQQLQVKRMLDDYWQYFDFAADGVLDADVWLNWQQGVQNVQLYINGERMALHYLNNEVQSWKLDHVIATAGWTRNERGWQTEVRGLEIRRNQQRWQQPAALSLTLDEPSQQLTAQASYLRIEDMVYLAGLVQTFLPRTDTDWNSSLQAWQPRGDVYDLVLRLPLDAPKNLQLAARFADLGYVSQNAAPSVTGADGKLRYESQRAAVDFFSRDVTLDFNKLFRQPLHVSQLEGQVQLLRDTNQWRVAADDLHIVTPHINTRNRLRLYIPENAPIYMDLFGRFDQGQSQFTNLYLPVGIMDEDTVQWLDRSIGVGNIPRGGVLFHGNLQDFPFDHGEGVMQVLFDVEKLRLDYFEDWPAIDSLAARVRFHNRSMLIDQGRGNIYGTSLSNTQVAIHDMAHAQLDISGEVSGALPEFIRFVADSPLHKPLAYVSHMQTSGVARLNLGLTIPLSGDTETQVNGKLRFDNNSLQLPDLNYRFTRLKGELAFTESGFSSPSLSAALDDHALQLRIEPQIINDVPHSRILAQGRVAAASVAAPLPALQKKLGGAGEWQVAVDVPLQTRADGVEVAVRVESSLLGVASDLPLSFGKAATDSDDFSLQLAILHGGNMSLQLAYGDVYRLEAQRRGEDWSVVANSASVRGEGRFVQGLPLDQIVELDLDYLDLATLTPASARTEAVATDTDKSLLPREIPPLDVKIANLNWDNKPLQNFTLQTRRSALGMVIEKLEVQAPHLTLSGSGSWLSSWRHPHTTTLDFTLRSDNLGAALNDLAGIKALEKTSGEANVHWQWKAQPYAFDWALLSGDADIKLKNGRLSDVEAGAGRVLGLLNFRTLLSLDFGSQVGGGFAFDNMNGRVRFDEGNAYTDDFSILGKAANVHMKGRIGLVAEDYDQNITVIPGVGNTLTLIGTVAGGPVTGVMVHLFQKLVGVDKIARYQYTVKGNWDKPRVNLIAAPDNTATTTEE